MPRTDISPHVIHFTKGDTDAEAFETLLQIVKERRLIAGSSCIKGNYNCVCFTEAPLWSIDKGMANPEAYKRYSPFGIMFDKHFMYGHGGRPVIYGPDEDFQTLPENLKWRHVRYEPTREPRIDWTWEREWRLKCDELSFSPENTVIVVLNQDYADYLRQEHELEQDMEVWQYSQIMDETIARQYREEFPWRVTLLKQ